MMKIHQIQFSPTGGTKNVADCLCEGFGREIVCTDLCLKDSQIEIPDISTDDLVVIAMPVFAGRVPALAVKRLGRIKSNYARCVIVVVYGNRAYDDALLEMQDVATDMGFRVVAAIGAVAEHSIARVYAAGRPDAQDRLDLMSYAALIMKKIETDYDYLPLVLPGKHPYKSCSVGPFPEANELCNGCGVCRASCPVDAIPMDNLRVVNKDVCISCMRCIAACPMKSRGIGLLETMIAEKLRPLCSTRKDNELFI
ncbi:MAG: 4Fe-4S binding protein [Prevotellaceae bacterium]|nr:4Fe-4S binding protein [Prevotellaceae bacterium]